MEPWSRDGVLWAAGFFEGEGCLHSRMTHTDNRRYSRTHVTWSISIANTDLDSLQRFQRVFQSGVIYGPRLVANNKPIWLWQSRSPAQIYAICVAMLPFMGARRTAKFTEFIEYFASYRYNGGEARVTRVLSAETRAKISATMRGKRDLAHQ